MKKIKSILFTIVLLTLIFAGCDKSTEPEEKPEAAFEKSVQSMNLTMMNMMNSQMYFGLFQMPQGLVDLPDIVLPVQERNFLQKTITKNNLISADSSLLNFFERLEALYGTHTYDGTQWIHTGSPSNEIVIIYPFVNTSNNTNHIMNVRIFGVEKSASLVQFSMEAKVDNIRRFYLDYAKVTGIDLLSVSPILQNIDVKGEMIDDNNNKNIFMINLSDDVVSIALTAGKMETLTFTISGNDFLSATDSLGQAAQNVTNVTITQGKIKIELTEFNVLNGDVGDIFYSSKKIADIMMVNDETFIYYTNGKQIAMADLMPMFDGFTNGQ